MINNLYRYTAIAIDRCYIHPEIYEKDSENERDNQDLHLGLAVRCDEVS